MVVVEVVVAVPVAAMRLEVAGGDGGGSGDKI